MKITFFQVFHNGDGFVAKEYVRQIIKELPNFEFAYLHKNHPDSLKDLNIPFGPIPPDLPDNSKATPKFVDLPNHLMINTWIGCYRRSRGPAPVYYDKRGINHDNLLPIWSSIFDRINEKFGTSLKIKTKEDYVGVIDFNFIDKTPIDSLFSTCQANRVLIANNQPMSKQSFDHDMAGIIEILSSEYQHVDFICTNKFKTKKPNILFTDDITNASISQRKLIPSWSRGTCDLNEIAYISTHCDVIVGKNSGPFIWCMIKDNIFDANKSIISFNKHERDSLLYNINYKCDYVWSDDYSDLNILETIRSKIK